MVVITHYPKKSAIALTTSAGPVRVGTCPAPSITASLPLAIFAARFWDAESGVITSRLPNEGRQCYLAQPPLHVHHFETFEQLHAAGQLERLTICLPHRRWTAPSSSGIHAFTNISMVDGKSVLHPSMKRAAPTDVPP
ncbi:MAG: hypothetical protein JWR21_2860 [Herminiimonas sp.]|nr:hypothetical protein [Herminiimonas sp.]